MNEDLKEKWSALEAMLKERFGSVPNMEAILFLIGVNEYRGRVPKTKFSKEQKQELMHVAVCHLLSQSGYYELKGYDEEGWPHYELLDTVQTTNLDEQDELLKAHVIEYFEI